MPGLKEVIISLTNRCNLRCRMCQIPAQKKEELSCADWEKVIRDASGLQAKTIVFSGGEPLLREDIFFLILSAKKLGMQACITSNGYLLDKEAALRLSASGVDVVNISLEGPEGVHDYLRGEGSFTKAVMALDNLRKHNIESTVATVVSGYNYRYLSSVAELAKEHAATTIKFQPFSRIFLCGKGEEDFLIPAQAAKELKARIEEVSFFCEANGIVTNPRGYLDEIPSYLAGAPAEKRRSCPALFSSCPIDPSGDFYPCWVIAAKENLIGNVREKGLFNLWNSQRRASVISRIQESGCPGCMMSCYDENFGKDRLEERISVNIGRLKRQGAWCYLKGKSDRMRRRVAFYISYRGSPRMLSGRLRKLFRRSAPPGRAPDPKQINAAFEEVGRAKRMITEEINSTK